MKKKIAILIGLVLGGQVGRAQYISEVLSYHPAPGQFINSEPWGMPASARSIEGSITGALSLGAFGGEVVFRFAKAVENHPGNPFGVDFTVFGNPMPNWSEPGIVWVMEDQNQNGVPDDTWYELAGSDFHFASSRRDAVVQYSNPQGDSALDVPWTLDGAVHGFIRANGVHPQPYYPDHDSFPDLGSLDHTYRGSLIQGMVDVDHPPQIISQRRAFGYADNQMRGRAPFQVPDNPYTPGVENSGGDAFDLDWAVDAQGNYVELDSVHFIKVQTGVLHQGGYLGEVSTEITGAVDVDPVDGMEGSTEVMVMGGLATEIVPGIHSLELFLFREGRPRVLPEISWTTSEPWAWVDEHMRLHAEGEGMLEVVAVSVTQPQLEARLTTVVRGTGYTAADMDLPARQLRVFPNPAREVVHLRAGDPGTISLLDLQGRMIMELDHFPPETAIPLSGMAPGMYLLRLENKSTVLSRIIMKR